MTLTRTATTTAAERSVTWVRQRLSMDLSVCGTGAIAQCRLTPLVQQASTGQRPQVEHEHVTRREVVELAVVRDLSPQDDPVTVGR